MSHHTSKGSGRSRKAQGHANSTMVGPDPLTNKIGDGCDIARSDRSRSVRGKSERAARALRKLLTGVTTIEEVEPCRSIQRRNFLAWKHHQSSASDEQRHTVDGRYRVYFGRRRMNNPIELCERGAAVPIGVPPSHTPDGRGDQGNDQKN